MSIVGCGLLHTHVPKWWIANHLDGLIKQLFTTFKIQFGECEMRLGWHYLLHARLDFENWSTSRSHWAFPGERYCGALIRQVRNSSLAKITPSLVRNSSRALAAMDLDENSSTTTPWPPRLKVKVTDCIPESLQGQVKRYQDNGYQFCQKGVGFYSTVWKVNDFAWFCDHNDINVNRTSRMYKVVAILRPNNDNCDRVNSHVFVLRRLDQLSLRRGYHNVFSWSLGDPMEIVGIVINTSLHSPSVHMCEVAIFQSAESGSLFVPICGNLPF